MKKTIALLFLAFVFLLSACAGKTGQEANAPAGTAAPEEQSPDPAEALYVYDPETDVDNRFGMLYNGFVETDSVSYWLGAESCFIYYIEKDGREYAPLCGKPDCMHELGADKANCNANTKKYLNGLSMFEGRLYFVSADRSDSDHICALYRMDTDGTNRERVMPIDNGSQAIQRFWIHRGRFFAITYTYRIEEGTPCLELALLCGEMKDKSVSPVFEKLYPAEECGWPRLFVNFYGDKALLGISFSNPNDSTALNEIYEYDMIAGETSERLSASGCDFQMCSLYMDSEGELFVSSYGMCWDRQTEAAVYILNGSSFEKLFDFDDGEPFGRAILFNDTAVGIRNDMRPDGEDTVWIKNLRGETTAKGTLTRNFLEDHTNTVNGGCDIAADENGLYCFYSGWLKDDPLYEFCVRYAVSDGGFVETLLAEH